MLYDLFSPVLCISCYNCNSSVASDDFNYDKPLLHSTDKKFSVLRFIDLMTPFANNVTGRPEGDQRTHQGYEEPEDKFVPQKEFSFDATIQLQEETK